MKRMIKTKIMMMTLCSSYLPKAKEKRGTQQWQWWMSLREGKKPRFEGLKPRRCVGRPMWGSKEEGKKKRYRVWTRLLGVGVHQGRAKSEGSFSELDV